MGSSRCRLATIATGILVVLIIVSIVIVCTSGIMNAEQQWETENRLPLSVVPSRYDILLHPDLDEKSTSFGNFTGTVKIELELKEDRTWFVIHGKYLDIWGAALENSEGSVQLKDPFEVPKNEWWVIQPSQDSIHKGSYTLTLQFKGQLTRSIVGFYRSVHTNSDGEKRYIATTKFEPTYARLAFPCFDEPAMKASYKVRLVKPASEEYIALSNSDVKSVKTEKGLTTVEFTETVKMSSYLAAFIVCDFERQKETHKMSSGQPVNVYARKEQISNAEEALQVALNVVNFYAQYFGIAYPLPKIDLIAIPDFVSGAMENWGLITFRETSILFNPDNDSPANRQSISNTVAHELAHMWFGNLVTMKWWTDLWLNEGFATFMAQKALDQMHPAWKVGDQFVVGTLLSVLELDAELSSHPVLQEVTNPDQITEIFDTISYNKGSSVILMLEAFMGRENFVKGLNSYLKANQYGNAETADLWRALQDYAPQSNGVEVNVAKVMDKWTRQMGFPVVTVNRTDSKVILSQKRFLSNSDAKYDPATSKYGFKWDIPIIYRTSESPQNSLVWLPSDKESIELSINSTDWIKINHNQRCYYRTNYDSSGWNALMSVLSQDPAKLDAVDRAGLINDVFSLADAEEIKYETALDLSKYLIREREYVPWLAANTVLSTLVRRLPNSEPLKKYGLQLISPIVKELSWSVGMNDDHLRRRLRALILQLACLLEDKDALSKANTLFDAWLKGGEKPHQDIRSVVYSYGLGNSYDENLWNLLFDKFKTERNTQEKSKLMAALASTPNETLLKRYIEIAKDESVIRSQDYFTVLSYISDNHKGVQLVWDFYRNEYENLVKRFSLNDRTFGRFIGRVTNSFNTYEKKLEVLDFFRKYPEAGAGAAARKQALEAIDNKVKWIKTHKESVESWLSNKQSVEEWLNKA